MISAAAVLVTAPSGVTAAAASPAVRCAGGPTSARALSVSAVTPSESSGDPGALSYADG